MLELHHDQTSPRGQTSSAEYCLFFCWGSLWCCWSTFCKPATCRHSDLMLFWDAGSLHGEVPGASEERFLFDFGQSVSCLWVRTGQAVLHLLVELLISSGHLHIHLVPAQGTELGRARSLRGTSSSLPQTPFSTPGAAGAGFGAGREGCAGDRRPYCALARV